MTKPEELARKLHECFRKAAEDERKGIKHKGLLVTNPNDVSAREYIDKAKEIRALPQSNRAS